MTFRHRDIEVSNREGTEIVRQIYEPVLDRIADCNLQDAQSLLAEITSSIGEQNRVIRAAETEIARLRRLSAILRAVVTDSATVPATAEIPVFTN